MPSAPVERPAVPHIKHGSPQESFRKSLESDWLKWITFFFPQVITKPFGAHHIAFWEWVGAIRRGKRPRPWISVWPRGGGKALTLGTPLPTPTGWTTMGEVQPGDELLDEKGQPCRVLDVSPVEIRDTYRVHFRGGGYLDASGDHLWTVLDMRSRRIMARLHRGVVSDWASWEHFDRPPKIPVPEKLRRYGNQTLTTAQMLSAGLMNSASRREYEWTIGVAQPFDLPDAELPIHPYVLGCWLGDGATDGSNISVGGQDVDETRARLQNCGYSDVRKHPRKNNSYSLNPIGLYTQLGTNGLLGNKHIPQAYLRAATKQRLQLLAGLCDTDGTVHRNGIEFVNTNRNIAEGVHELAISLGYRASIRSKRAKLYGKDCGECWVVLIAAHPSEVFQLERKMAGVEQQPMVLSSKLHYIEKIDRLPDQPVRCVIVDSPNHLYLAGRHAIPTHNSTNVELALTYLAARNIRTYAVYVSYSQDQADAHVQAIADTLESPEIGLWYPDISDRAVGKFGNWKGWRRNRLHTKAGFIVDALGLDTASRGLKVGTKRPDMLVLDDIDDSNDSPETTQRKIDTLTRRILPATTNDSVVMGIQNLIHSNSMFAQLVDGRAEFLSDAIISGPIPALENFEYQTILDPDGRPRTVITRGIPTWKGLNRTACQNEITKDGISVFLSELQHVVPEATGGMFDSVTFRHVKSVDVPPLDKIVCWVDPAVTSTDDSDAMGVQIDGIARDGIMYRLFSWEKRATPLEALRLAITKAEEYGAVYVGIETDQGGDTWSSVFREARDSLGPQYHHLTMRSAKAGQGYGSKVHRASQMLSDYERGLIVHVEGTHHTLEQALLRFPAVKPFDLVDAAQWSWRDLRRLSRPMKATPATRTHARNPQSRAVGMGGARLGVPTASPQNKLAGRRNLRVVDS